MPPRPTLSAALALLAACLSAPLRPAAAQAPGQAAPPPGPLLPAGWARGGEQLEALPHPREVAWGTHQGNHEATARAAARRRRPRSWRGIWICERCGRPGGAARSVQWTWGGATTDWAASKVNVWSAVGIESGIIAISSTFTSSM